MGFKWFWVRISDEWIVGNQAAVIFGVAAAFTCLLTAVLISPGSLPDTGVWSQVSWATLGVLGPLSAIFLWGGMRRYQRMRGQARFGDTPTVRLLMLVGICWTAVVYYLAVFLRERQETSAPVPSSALNTLKRRQPVFGKVLIAGWVSYLIGIVALFSFPKAVVGLLHGAGRFILLVQLILMFATVSYFVVRFIRGAAQR